jgi:AcrR family transcriptional regulator
VAKPPLDEDRAAVARAERRRQILDAAKHVFADAGYHGASIGAIIERAAIARGTFYLYFESKEAVFGALLDEAMHALRARIVGVETAPGAPPPEHQLLDSLARVLEFIVADRALAVVLLSSTWTPDAEAAERLQAFYDEIRKVIAGSLETGARMGLLRPMHPQRTAAALLGLVRGIVELCVTEKLEGPISEVTRELVDVALRGILHRG